MAWRFNAPTDQLTGDGWAGSVSTVTCWLNLVTDTNTSADPWGIYPNAGGAGAIRALLGTDVDGTTLLLFDSSFANQSAGTLVVGTWYFVGCVMDGTQWTVYHGTNPAALNVVGPVTRVSFNNPGSILFSLAVEPYVGDMAAIKKWTAALTAGEMALEAAHYEAIRQTDFHQGFTTNTLSLLPDVGGGSDPGGLTTGGTSVDLVRGPTQLDYPVPTFKRAGLPYRYLKPRRGRFFVPTPLPVNNSPQALPPQYFRTSRAHQKLRRIDRSGFYSYPVLETAPQPTPTPPPDDSAGSFAPSWRRRIYRRRRRPVLISGIPQL